MKCSHRPCPLCGCEEMLPLADLEFGDFDRTSLERRLILVACRSCGQIFNAVDLEALPCLLTNRIILRRNCLTIPSCVRRIYHHATP